MTDETAREMEPLADGGAATAPVTTQPATPVLPGGSRARWAIGLGVAALAIAVIAAAVIVFGSRPTPPALTYIPADAVMVAEIRPDLPGDQLQKVGNLLAHFPGFADQSTLDSKLDESFAQLFGRASDGRLDYRTDIKPWLSGPAFVALMPPPDAAGGSADNPMAFTRGLVSLTTTGAVTCDAPFRDMAVTHETYQGLDLVLGPQEAVACVVDKQQALLGDPASVRAALDAHAGSSSVDRTASYQKARASLQGDQLAAIYISGSGYLDILERMSAMTPGMSGMLPSLRGVFPEWVIEGVRAEDDAVVLEVAGGPSSAPAAGASPMLTFRPVPPAHASAILPFAPANTVAYFEGQGTGVALLNSIDQLRAIPPYDQVLGALDDANPEELLGWIQDAGVIVTADSAGVGGGLVLIAEDASSATSHAAMLKGVVALGQLRGLSVESTDSTVNGATVTTYTIGNLGSLLPPGQLPPGMDLTSVGTITFSVATKDKAILFGSEGFVTAALSIQSGSGLADQAGFKAAMSRSVANSQTTAYVAIREIVTLAEPLIPAEKKAAWENDLKPYLAPFQAFSMTVSANPSSGSRGRFIVTISNP
jgi:hypothetical protein